MHVRFPPELKQPCHASLRVDQGTCVFPSRLSNEAFPQGCPTCHSGVMYMYLEAYTDIIGYSCFTAKLLTLR